MVQVLPQFDPGAAAGQGLGSGLGLALDKLGQRQYASSALDSLKNLNLGQMSESDVISEVGSRLVGTGAEQFIDPMVKSLLAQKTGAALSGLYGGQPGQGAGGQGAGGAGASGYNIPVSQQQQEQMAMQMSGGQAPGVQGQMQGQMPGSESAGVPGAGPGGFDILTPQEQQAYRDLVAQGSYQAAEAFRQNVAARKKEGLDYYKASKQVSDEMRQASDMRVDQLITDLDADQGVLTASPDRWRDLGYQYMQEEMQKPGQSSMTQDQLWSKARQRLQGKINDLSAISRQVRPTMAQDPAKRLEATKSAISQHLSKYGDNSSERQALKTQLMGQGWSLEEATLIVNPKSGEVTESLAVLGPKGSARTDEKSLSALSDSLASNMKDTDSLYGIKSDLVRDYGLSDKQATDVLMDVVRMRQDQGLLSDFQSNEVALLDRTIKPSLYEVFSPKATKFLDKTVTALSYLNPFNYATVPLDTQRPTMQQEEGRSAEEYWGPYR